MQTTHPTVLPPLPVADRMKNPNNPVVFFDVAVAGHVSALKFVIVNQFWD